MISLQKIITKLKSLIDKNTADITALNNDLTNKCVIFLGLYDCPGNDPKELTRNLAVYAVNHGLALNKVGIIIGGWQGKQYGITIVSHLDYMINVTFIGSGNTIVGFINPSLQYVDGWQSPTKDRM